MSERVWLLRNLIRGATSQLGECDLEVVYALIHRIAYSKTNRQIEEEANADRNKNKEPGWRWPESTERKI